MGKYRSWRKYRNFKVQTEDGEIDSLKELRRYNDLKLLEKAGLIKDLRRQVEYELIPQQREPDTVGSRGGVKKGKVIEHPCRYIADFVYFDTEKGCEVVEDTKGFKTKDYIIKRKLMLYLKGIRVQEV